MKIKVNDNKETVTCYLYNCGPKKYRCRFMKHKNGDACVTCVTVKYILCLWCKKLRSDAKLRS